MKILNITFARLSCADFYHQGGSRKMQNHDADSLILIYDASLPHARNTFHMLFSRVIQTGVLFFFYFFLFFFFASLPLSWHKFLQIFNVAVGLVAGSLASFLLIYAWMGCLDAVFPHVFSTGQFYPKPLKNFADILFDQWYSKSGIPPPPSLHVVWFLCIL